MEADPNNEVLPHPAPMQIEIGAVTEPVPTPFTIWWEYCTSVVSSLYFFLGLFIVSSSILIFLCFFLKYHHLHSKTFPCYEKLKVSTDGSAMFRTIFEAVHAAKPYSLLRTCIVIGSGEFKEMVTVPKEKTNIVFIGAGINKTIISSKNLYSASNRGILNVHGRGFVAMDLTVANTASPSEGDAVALVNEAGESVFFRCSFIGFGKTLYAWARRQFYRECEIYGSRYFIYGGAEAFFQMCNVKASRDDVETVVTGNVRMSTLDETEFVFHMCAFGPVGNVVNSSIYLGAPVTQYSRVVVMESDLDGSVLGWKLDSSSPCTSDVYLAQYMNRGPGASNEHNTQLSYPCIPFNISRTLAQQFSLRNFFGDYSWIPKQVPRKLDL